MSIYKICTKCDTPKSLDCFSKHIKRKDKKQTMCKSCSRRYKADRRSKLTPEQKSYISRQNLQKRVHKLGLESVTKSCRIAQKKYRSKFTIEENREKNRNYQKLYLQKLDNRIKHNLRCRLSAAIKHGYKTSSAVRDLGCSIEFFKEYLNAKFTEGMNWDNYGEWHIDHIKPLSRVDFSIAEDIKSAVHYTNLQPLWALDNFRKH